MPPSLVSPDELKADGLRLFEQGRNTDAIARFQAAADAYRQQENLTGWAEMWNNIGVTQRRRKKLGPAAEALNQALVGFRKTGDVNRQGQTLANLGDIHAARREHSQAAGHYGEAAALLAKSGDKARQSQVLRALSLHYLRRGQWTQAMLFMEQSLSTRPRPGVGGFLFRWLLRFALRLAGLLG